MTSRRSGVAVVITSNSGSISSPLIVASGLSSSCAAMVRKPIVSWSPRSIHVTSKPCWRSRSRAARARVVLPTPEQPVRATKPEACRNSVTTSVNTPCRAVATKRSQPAVSMMEVVICDIRSPSGYRSCRPLPPRSAPASHCGEQHLLRYLVEYAFRYGHPLSRPQLSERGVARWMKNNQSVQTEAIGV